MTQDRQYPNGIAPRADILEVIHGHLVADPYRWLEDLADCRTAQWLAAQESLYAGHRAALRGRKQLAQRLWELHSVGAVSLPTWRGDRWFGTRRRAGQEHAVLYTATSADSLRVLVDPVWIDGSGNTTLDGWQPDHEGRTLAYLLSAGGTEESSLWVMDVRTGRQLDGPIHGTRHSQVAWRPWPGLPGRVRLRAGWDVYGGSGTGGIQGCPARASRIAARTGMPCLRAVSV